MESIEHERSKCHRVNVSLEFSMFFVCKSYQNNWEKIVTLRKSWRTEVVLKENLRHIHHDGESIQQVHWFSKKSWK